MYMPSTHSTATTIRHWALRRRLKKNHSVPLTRMPWMPSMPWRWSLVAANGLPTRKMIPSKAALDRFNSCSGDEWTAAEELSEQLLRYLLKLTWLIIPTSYRYVRKRLCTSVRKLCTEIQRLCISVRSFCTQDIFIKTNDSEASAQFFLQQLELLYNSNLHNRACI